MNNHHRGPAAQRSAATAPSVRGIARRLYETRRGYNGAINIKYVGFIRKL